MRPVLVTAALALSLWSTPVVPQQIPTAANIEGIVVRADTGVPIAGAQVRLTTGTELGMSPQRPPTIQPVTTGADGKFVFQDVGPGVYGVAATADGFVRQEYGQKALSGRGRAVFVNPGQTLKDIQFRLIATGTVIGRVVDENGQPARGAPVQILRSVYSARGRNLDQVAVGTADDRGEYRLYGIPPGRYFLLVGTPPGDPRFVLRGVSVPGTNGRFSLVYYPDAAEIDQASPVEVKGGEEIAFDMRVQRQVQTYRVRGRVVAGTGAVLPANLSIMLMFRFQDGTGLTGNAPSFNVATGTFEFLNIVPGEYIVQAVTGNPNRRPVVGGGIDQATEASRPSDHTAIRVADADVDGVVLTLSTGVTVNGRVMVEGQSLTSVPNLDHMRLRFSFPIPMIGQTAPAALTMAADGSFQVVGLREGEYRTEFDAPAGFYVKSIQYGGDDILSKPLRFSGPGPGVFEVVLRAGGVQVSGTLTNVRSQPVPGMTVFLVPAQRGRADLYRHVITDQTGKFTINAVPPGEYKLFSWEAAENGAQFDPEFLKQYEQQGKSVHVTDVAAITADIKAIPAP